MKPSSAGGSTNTGHTPKLETFFHIKIQSAMKDATATTENQNLPATQSATDNMPATAAAQREMVLTTMDDLTSAVEASKALGDVAKLEVGTINLKTDYLSFETPGESVRRVFLGFTMKMSVDPTTGEEKELLPAAQLYDPATETINICMQKVLVGVLFEVGYPRGAALQITYKGDKKGKNGLKYQVFDIRALIPGKK